MNIELSNGADIEEKISILFEQTVKCPNCGGEAMLTVSEYKSLHETLVITTLKCSRCGYKKSDIIPIIAEDENKCLEIKIEKEEDLKTLIFIPPGSSIEIPELSISIELAELADIHIGNYVTIEGILLDTVEKLEKLCQEPEQGLDSTTCIHDLMLLKKVLENSSVTLTVRIKNSVGNIKVVRSYRGNYGKC